MIKVGVVVLGADGYMAGNALKALNSAKNLLEDEGIYLFLEMAADLRFFSRRNAQDILARQRIYDSMPSLGQARFESTAEPGVLDIFRRKEIGTYDADYTLFYDATPTRLHTPNLMLVADYADENNFRYFGEKPIFTDIINLKSIKNPNFPKKFVYCDFIESVNPAVLAISNFMTRNNFTTEKLSLWRSGSSGLKHIIGHDQLGVEGGALLDKSPHDFSIIVKLLGAENISTFRVKEALIEALVPWKSDTGDDVSFLSSVGGEFITKDEIFFEVRDEQRSSRHELPADGVTTADLSIDLTDGKVVDAKVISGWIGVTAFDESWRCASEEAMVNDLKEIGVNTEDWLFSETFSSRAGEGCLETQARIVLIEGEIDGKRARIVANLINCSRDHEVSREALSRWAKVFVNDGEKWELREELVVETNEVYEDQKVSDLAEIFCEVARDVVGRSSANHISDRATFLVHEMMLSTKDKSLEAAARSHPHKNKDLTARLLKVVKNRINQGR